MWRLTKPPAACGASSSLGAVSITGMLTVMHLIYCSRAMKGGGPCAQAIKMIVCFPLSTLGCRRAADYDSYFGYGLLLMLRAGCVGR